MFQDFTLPDGVLGCLLSGGGGVGAVGQSGAEEYLTIEETAQRLKLAPKTLRNKMAAGLLREGQHYFRPPGLGPRFKWSAVVVWLEGAPQALKPRQQRPRAGGVAPAPDDGVGIPMTRGYLVP